MYFDSTKLTLLLFVGISKLLQIIEFIICLLQNYFHKLYEREKYKKKKDYTQKHSTILLI